MSILFTMLVTIMLHSTLLLLLSSSVSSSSVDPKPKPKPKPAMFAKLIHVDSIHSPFYIPNTTIKQRADNDLQRSHSRLMYLNDNDVMQTNSIEIPIGGQKGYKMRSIYLARLNVGSLKIGELMAMDTGSKVSWVFCTFPGNPAPGGLYSPFRSDAVMVPCPSETCNNGPLNHCVEGPRSTQICGIVVNYANGFQGGGLLVQDKFSFERVVDTRLTYFGCVKNTDDFPKFDGILALGVGNISVLSQWGYTEFTYCFNNLSNIFDVASVLVVGKDDRFLDEVDYARTPLLIVGAKYYVQMLGVTVGDKLVQFEKPLRVIMDTGSPVTYLPIDICRDIEDEVNRLLYPKKLERVSNSNNRLCYEGRITRNLIDFPPIVLQLNPDANLELLPENAFRQIDDEVFCLAILPPSTEGNDLIGAIAQQRYSMTYDLEYEELRFKYLDCSYITP